MDNSILFAVFIFLAVDTVAAVFLIASKIRESVKKRKISHFGDMAEEKVSQYITSCFPGSVLFNNILLSGEKGLTEIDHLLICRWGVYVIETKSHNGKIVIGEKEWVQYYGNKIIKFHSPLLQNETHKKTVKKILKKSGLRNIKVCGLVVFTSEKVHFSENVKDVIKLDRLHSRIKNGGYAKRYQYVTSSPRGKYLSKTRISQIATVIENNCDKNIFHKRHHDEKISSYGRYEMKYSKKGK